MSILPDPETFRKLATGSLTGPGPTVARCLLATLAVPYAWATATRNFMYDCGLLQTTEAMVPVISIGNLTAGGTGKTPLVAWVCRRLMELGKRPAIVSRGYGAGPNETSDEAKELAILVPGVIHIANRDRVAGAAEAVSKGADVVVLDDGFQHRRLARDLDIVAVDASDPFGCDHLLPRGLLRESLRGLGRADAITLTRATSVDETSRERIRSAILHARRAAPPKAWAMTEHRPVAIRSQSGLTEPLARIRGEHVAAFCGIGNPAAFRKTVLDSGAKLVGFKPFPDHHAYSRNDLETLASWATSEGATMLVTTLKDLVRIRADRLQDIPLWAIEVAIAAVGSVESLDQLIRETVHARAAHR